jgi:hypothetical protein
MKSSHARTMSSEWTPTAAPRSQTTNSSKAVDLEDNSYLAAVEDARAASSSSLRVSVEA